MLSVAGALLVAGCGGGGGGSATTPTEPNPGPGQPVESTGTVTGTVIGNGDGLPVAGASVRNGQAQATTGDDGRFVLEKVAVSGRAVIRVQAAGFAEALAVTPVAENGTADVAVQLEPVGVAVSVDPADEVTVAVPDSTARVDLPAGALVRADGTPASGAVSAALTPVAPATNVNAMPGEYRIATADGSESFMESWGAINVTFTDADGNRLNLAQGKQATIRIPVSTRSDNNPTTIPLFYFNEETGFWVQEGEATLAGTGADQYYQGTVGHFSYWNADMVMDTIYVNGCVQPGEGAGDALANILVSSDGIDYSNASTTRTDAEGRFRIAMKRNARAALIASNGDKVSNTLVAGPSSSDITLDQCLTLSALESAFSVKLTWGAQPADVDSHLFAPDGSRVYFSSRGYLTQAPFAQLDVDDISGFGPEVTTVTRLMVGTYTFAAHNYSGSSNPGMTGSPVRVELNRGGTLTVFTPTAGETNTTDWWVPFRLTVDAQCGVTVERVGTWSAERPASAPRTEPVYCAAP